MQRAKTPGSGARHDGSGTRSGPGSDWNGLVVLNVRNHGIMVREILMTLMDSYIACSFGTVGRSERAF